MLYINCTNRQFICTLINFSSHILLFQTSSTLFTMKLRFSRHNEISCTKTKFQCLAFCFVITWQVKVFKYKKDSKCLNIKKIVIPSTNWNWLIIAMQVTYFFPLKSEINNFLSEDRIVYECLSATFICSVYISQQ